MGKHDERHVFAFSLSMFLHEAISDLLRPFGHLVVSKLPFVECSVHFCIVFLSVVYFYPSKCILFPELMINSLQVKLAKDIVNIFNILLIFTHKVVDIYCWQFYFSSHSRCCLEAS